MGRTVARAAVYRPGRYDEKRVHKLRRQQEVRRVRVEEWRRSVHMQRRTVWLHTVVLGQAFPRRVPADVPVEGDSAAGSRGRRSVQHKHLPA